MAESIDTPSLRVLAKVGAVEKVRIAGVPGGYAMVVCYGMSEKVLRVQRGPTRVFKSLDAAARFARGLGFSQCVLDLSDWPKSEPKNKFNEMR
ncbi:conserved hypothetical protein (plasmid) [Nitrosococcus oceani ATCC 19707]|uniref:Partition protein C n=2 Tax=Nitrosococcus oceani TaxID=1229 RepID=Q3JF43_NITOC|nr:hypothetical protein [Nitrosococcus oceani]ABA56553.1 conserved hypothetical protein [Nitrosococcus oceani ATCC 19707]EDZ65226.1 hypothetical protein NOC27_3390 [Nitrosococcus oceani AFC27]KFI17774.1 hypothetical protein IB75_18620 [Nitrosococcus oceani C-27]BBM60829.1 hypothetical protein NONS58_P0430 [Nitrosococcus oceani]